MFVVELIAVACCLAVAVQAIRLYLADADLTLMWMTKFGHKPSIFAGKVAIITGASSGIGEYLAYELSKNGCRLVLTARRGNELERVKLRCLARSQLRENDIMVVAFDIMDQSIHAAVVAQVMRRFGQIDILVNNAGRTQRALIMDTDMSVYEEMMSLNLLSAISLTKAVLPHMIERKQGIVVAVSSIGGKSGGLNVASYCATKHAMHGWFNSLRQEMYADNITVTIACPGPVHSEILKHAYTGTTDKEYNGVIQPGEIRMATPRCAYLIAVAMANRLEECWIATHPSLTLVYGLQYLPTYATRYFCRMMSKNAAAVKEGRNPMYSREDGSSG